MAALPVPQAAPSTAALSLAPGVVQDMALVVEPRPPRSPAAVPLSAAGPAEPGGGDLRAADLPAGGKLASELQGGEEPVSDRPAGDRPTGRADTMRTGLRTAIRAASPEAARSDRIVRVARAPLPVVPEPGNPDVPSRPGRPTANGPAGECIPGSAPVEATGRLTVATTTRARAPRPAAPRMTPRPPTAQATASGRAGPATAGPSQAPHPPGVGDLMTAADPPRAPDLGNAPETLAAGNLIAAAGPVAIADPVEPGDPMTDPVDPTSPVFIAPAESTPEWPPSRLAAHPELPAPVVNVTIGRVEVRQPSAPPPPPVPASGPRPMSLDQYLDQRNRSLP